MSIDRARGPALLVAALLASPGAMADDDASRPVISSYGGVGVFETRSARMADDGELATTVYVDQNGFYRTGLNFQITPWLEGTFRYAKVSRDSVGLDPSFDRSFDIKIRLMKENGYWPELAVGLQDFLGTGIFSGEYVVASKRIGPFDFSAGLGWGRLGTRGGLTNPFTLISDRFKTRELADLQGGQVEFGSFFRGEEIAPFGSVVYDTPFEGLKLAAEWNGDDQSGTGGTGITDMPVNVGAIYTPFAGVDLAAVLVNGEEFALRLTLRNNISEPFKFEKLDPRPPGFAVREVSFPADDVDGLSAPIAPPATSPVPQSDFLEAMDGELSPQGVRVVGVAFDGDLAQVKAVNAKFASNPKAVGRIMRAMTRYAPEDIERFQVILTESGVPIAAYSQNRARLEASAWEKGYTAEPDLFGYAFTTDPVDLEGSFVEEKDLYPAFNWSVRPSLSFSFFDPAQPLRYQLDGVASASVTVAPGLSAGGSVRAKLLGDIGESDVVNDSVLPRVRSDATLYAQESDVYISNLSAEYFTHPRKGWYGRVVGGIVESNFGAVGGEVLYVPEGSRLSYGAEAYYAKQRTFDRLFEFQDYDVVTGHASVYWDSPIYDLDFALHAGRYLAGDWGATLDVSRNFANGWQVGAFATLTDVPFSEFGEGSFDKGIYLNIPLNALSPYEAQDNFGVTLRPVLRDGGARLNVPGRLYGRTRSFVNGDARRLWSSFSE